MTGCISDVQAFDRYLFEDPAVAADAISGQRPKRLRYGVRGVWKESATSKYMPCYDPSTGAVIALAPQCTAERGGGVHRGGSGGFPRLARHAGEQARAGAVPHEGAAGQAPGRADLPLRPGERQEVGRGHGRRPQGDRGRGVRLRRPAPHEGRVADERLAGLRHRPLQRAARRVRRHRAVELPGHDPPGLDGAHLHRHRQQHGAQSRQFRSAVRHAHHRTLEGGRAAAGRAQRRHDLPARGGDPPDPSRHQGRLLRRLDQRRPAHLHHRGRQRQARAGADRGQESRPGAGGLRPGAHRPGHRQLVLRLRRRALHGASGGRRRGLHRRQAGGSVDAGGLQR